MHKISEAIVKCFKNGGKLFIAGNGGSASLASHMAGEFVGRFEKERRALPALSLTDDVTSLTAIANDYGYSEVFVRQLQAHAKTGDVLLTMSTSGKSENIIKAISYARVRGLTVHSFPTKGTGSTAECQETHLKLLHRIAREVESEFAE